jgi:hypothetical protein
MLWSTVDQSGGCRNPGPRSPAKTAGSPIRSARWRRRVAPTGRGMPGRQADSPIAKAIETATMSNVIAVVTTSRPRRVSRTLVRAAGSCARDFRTGPGTGLGTGFGTGLGTVLGTGGSTSATIRPRSATSRRPFGRCRATVLGSAPGPALFGPVRPGPALFGPANIVLMPASLTKHPFDHTPVRSDRSSIEQRALSLYLAGMTFSMTRRTDVW